MFVIDHHFLDGLQALDENVVHQSEALIHLQQQNQSKDSVFVFLSQKICRQQVRLCELEGLETDRCVSVFGHKEPSQLLR